MRYLLLLLAWCVFLLGGCQGASDDGGADPPPDSTQAAQAADSTTDPQSEGKPADEADSDEPKTAIVRSLLEALDDAEAEDDDVKDELEEILRESDAELSQVLGDNPRLAIERANQKLAVPVIGQPQEGVSE